MKRWLLIGLTSMMVVPPPVAGATEETIAISVVLHAPAGALDARRAALLEGLREAYAPHGICFDVRVEPLREDDRELRRNADRHALRAHLVDRALNAFLVDRMEDPYPSASTRRAAARAGFEPSGRLAGAHILAPGRRPASYVIVTAGASRLTLAHEVGHFLGAGHHRDPTNIMSYGRARVAFDERQVRVFRARARRLLRARDVERAHCATRLDDA